MAKRKTEQATRRNLLRRAKLMGADGDLQNLFNKWDTLIALAPPNERSDMSKMAILEVQSLLDIHAEEHDGLTINNEIIIKANPNKNI